MTPTIKELLGMTDKGDHHMCPSPPGTDDRYWGRLENRNVKSAEDLWAKTNREDLPMLVANMKDDYLVEYRKYPQHKRNPRELRRLTDLDQVEEMMGRAAMAILG